MQNIGRYRIEGELGRGAMGIVHRAVDTVIGRTVAIKTIRLDTFTDPAERERLKARLLREAKSAGLLSHPNIVTVFDVGEERGIAYIAMEFVQGRTLDQYLRDERRVTREQFLAILTQVAAALDYAHGQGVVHRDIKPGNLMLSDAGPVKIADFGVAKLLSHQATQSDMVLGTPSYMAPEQIDARSVDGKADQYALAVIAYELLAGERPFIAESLPALLYKIVREDPAAPHRLNATLNERVSAILLRGLAKAATERFSTCSVFARDLSAALAACPHWEPMELAAAATQATVAAPAPRPPQQQQPPPPQLQPLATTAISPVPRRALADPDPEPAGLGRWWLIAPLALAALAAGIYWFTQQPTQTIETKPPSTEASTADPSRPSPLAEAVKPTVDPSATPPAETATTTTQEPTAPQPAATEVAPKPPQPPPPVRPALQAGAPQSGEVEIASTPSGATVRIDDTRDQCKTPCSMELSQGRHVLRFSLEGHREGVLVIMVPQESSAAMRLDPLMGTLMVATSPAGAQILINGQPRTEVSPASLRLAPGKYRLTLRKEGQKEHSQEVEVRDQTIAHLEFTWQQ